MTPLESISRLVGLAAIAIKASVSAGHTSFDWTIFISPSVKLTVSRNARIKFGRRLVITYDTDICAVGHAIIRVGSGVYLGPRCMLSAHEEISIGDGCLFGPDVKIFDNNHRFSRGEGVVRGQHRSAPVRIGRNVWLGANVVILKGVTIGDGAVIGAGIVVREDVAAGRVVDASTSDLARLMQCFL